MSRKTIFNEKNKPKTKTLIDQESVMTEIKCIDIKEGRGVNRESERERECVCVRERESKRE